MADIKSQLLYYSARGDNTNLEKLLNNRKINLNIIKDTKGNTPLILASANGHLDTVNFLLSKGADPDSVNNKDDRELNNRNKLGRTPILEASANGHADVVDLLHRETYGYDRDNDGNSSIILASANGHRNVVGLLLSYGDVGDHVMFNKKKKIYGINDINESKQTPLIVASKNGHRNVVEILLGMARSEEEYNQLINQKDYMGYTSIMWASANGHADVVKLLLSRGAVTDMEDSLLKLASEYGHANVVEVLLNNGINPNDPQNSDSILWASAKGYTDVVELLLFSGANPNYKNNKGTSSIIIATIRGHTNIVKLLLKNGANPNDQDNDGNTALIYAFRYNDLYTIKLLLDYGAEIGNKEQLILEEASPELQEEVKKILDQKKSMLASYIIRKEMLHGQYMDSNSENDLAEYMGAKGGKKRKTKTKTKKNKKKFSKRRYK